MNTLSTISVFNVHFTIERTKAKLIRAILFCQPEFSDVNNLSERKKKSMMFNKVIRPLNCALRQTMKFHAAHRFYS